MGDEASLGLDEAYSVETPDDNRRLYAQWAHTYDDGFIDAKGYRYHREVARVLLSMGKPDGVVLDVGCGTGQVGRALANDGVTEIDGIDISPEMLDQAGSLGLYGSLTEADLTLPIDLETDRYGAMVSAGAFTHGHLPPESLGELIRVVRPGGHAAIGVNAAHFGDLGFAAWLDSAVSDGVITAYCIEDVQIYDGSDPSNPDDMAHVVTFSVCEAGDA